MKTDETLPFFKFLPKLFTKDEEKTQNETRCDEKEKLGVESVTPDAQSEIPESLNKKVDKFINWYTQNMVIGHYTDIGEYHVPNDMRNFIEKIAVWYELRYPDYEINRILPCCGQELTNVSTEMFANNPYISEVLEGNEDIRYLDWEDFYNVHSFISSLPYEEKWYFEDFKYPPIVYFDLDSRITHFHLTTDGTITAAEEMSCIASDDGQNISSIALEGRNIKEAIEIMTKIGIVFPINSEMVRAVIEFNTKAYQRTEMLKCAMYRIIERGGDRIGPRRAFLFAKEFNLNIDIPMKYGVSHGDPGLRKFVNEYIKAGGSKSLVCYVGYFSRANKYEKVKKTTVQELILSTHNDAVSFYTEEETELHQELLNTLINVLKNK